MCSVPFVNVYLVLLQDETVLYPEHHARVFVRYKRNLSFSSGDYYIALRFSLLKNVASIFETWSIFKIFQSVWLWFFHSNLLMLFVALNKLHLKAIKFLSLAIVIRSNWKLTSICAWDLATFNPMCCIQKQILLLFLLIFTFITVKII